MLINKLSSLLSNKKFPVGKNHPTGFEKIDIFDEDFAIFDEDLTKIFVANMLDYEIF